MTPRRIVVSPLAVALVASLGAAVAAFADVRVVAATLACAAAGVTAFEIVRRRIGALAPESVVERASQHAETGRRLVIYERETGLFAHWYLALRGQEECDRARRYDRQLTLLVMEPTPGADAWETKDQLAAWLGANLRSADLAGYLGNGRYVVLMPETGEPASRHVVARLREETRGVDLATSQFPADGAAFEELYAVAARRLAEPAPSARADGAPGKHRPAPEPHQAA